MAILVAVFVTKIVLRFVSSGRGGFPAAGIYLNISLSFRSLMARPKLPSTLTLPVKKY